MYVTECLENWKIERLLKFSNPLITGRSWRASRLARHLLMRFPSPEGVNTERRSILVFWKFGNASSIWKLRNFVDSIPIWSLIGTVHLYSFFTNYRLSAWFLFFYFLPVCLSLFLWLFLPLWLCLFYCLFLSILLCFSLNWFYCMQNPNLSETSELQKLNWSNIFMEFHNLLIRLFDWQ